MNRVPMDRGAQAEELMRRAAAIVRVWDEAVRIPGLGWRIGLDPIIGLVPGVGDVIGAVVSLGLLVVAARLGASAPILLRMTGNIAIDTVVGAIPILGDLFDVAWKANRKNYDLLERWRVDPRSVHRASAALVGGLVVLSLGIAGLVGWAAVAAVRALLR